MPNSGCCAPFCRCRGASAAVTSSWRTRAVARWRCSSAASTCWCRACARSWGTIRASHGSSRPCGGPATCSMCATCRAAWVGARCCAAPIERLVLAARAMGQGLERPPLPEDGSTEFREASRVFNQLQTTLQQRLQERDRVVASVSHDLRTPLTRLRLRAEHLHDAADRSLFRRDIAEMDALITTTLDHLRGVAAPEPPVWTDIKALVDSLADDQQACGHWVPVHGRAGALLVQPLALRRCLGNLLSNAVRYGVQAEVFLWDDGREVGIEVRDHGPGLPEAELEHVLQPFVRLEAAAQRYRGGMGLGLSIARDIALRHQGQLQLRNRPEGGLMAVVRLPRQGVPPARVT